MEGMLVDDGTIAYKSQDIPLKTATYIVFDVETTGLSVNMIKFRLAAVKVRMVVVDTFERFSDPSERLSETIKNLTGITDEMLQGQPDMGQF